MTRFVQLVLFLAAASLLSNGITAGAQESMSVNISGKWLINDKLSDNPREVLKKKMEELRANRGSPDGGPAGGPGGEPGRGFEKGGFGGGGRRGGMKGGRGGGPAGDQSGGYQNREQMQERSRSHMGAPSEILITQHDGIITMICTGGDTTTIVPDGKEHKSPTMRGEVKTQAEWKDFALHVRTQRQGKPELARLYRISDQGRLEVVTLVQLPGSDESIELKTVYDEKKKE